MQCHAKREIFSTSYVVAPITIRPLAEHLLLALARNLVQGEPNPTWATALIPLAAEQGGASGGGARCPLL
jgi:hypothetical protein